MPPTSAPSREAPASFAQQRLWAQLDPASAYVNSAALQVRGPLDVGALEGSVQEIVRRHEVLRTVLAVSGEEVLATLWAALLGLDRVGVHQDFFELGGHSLLATQLLARVRKLLRAEVPIRDFFESPTIAAMAQVLLTCEARPGQAERIARAMVGVQSMSDENVRLTLERVRRGPESHG